MNTAVVSRTLASVPERVARVQSGSLFNPTAPGMCAHPDRVAHLARFLEWLGPLREVTSDDQRAFGLVTPYGKPAFEAPLDEEAESEPQTESEPEPQNPLPLAS
jgi:hypothetical protein